MHASGCARAFALAVFAVSLAASGAGAIPFSSSLERFEADGNRYGSADGVFDLVDEFDNGVLGPEWVLLLGTVVESAGALTARDPGIDLTSLGIPQELSTVESTAELENGEGDFSVATYWTPTPLEVNRQFFFHLYGEYPVIESSGITVNNFDAATAAAQGAPVGWSIGRQRVFPIGNEEPPVIDYVAIDPMTITGRIVLRMTFEDATDLLTCAFSLDGGATFQSPFPPLQAFKRSPHAELLLGAAALPTAPPPASCPWFVHPVRVKFQKLSSPSGEQAFRMRGRVIVMPGVPPVLDPTTQGALFGAAASDELGMVYQAPPGALGSGGCGPDDGWRNSGRVWKYTNRTGAIPPLCSPGSANGLRQVTVRDDRERPESTIRFSLVARNTTFANGLGSGRAMVGLGGLDSEGNPLVCSNSQIQCVGRGTSAACR